MNRTGYIPWRMVLPCILLCSGCALFRKGPAGETAARDPESPRFIPGIVLDRTGKTSSHGSTGYQSQAPVIYPPAPTPGGDQALQEKYARVLGVEDSAISNLELYHFIDYWWGTPYRLGGTDREGIDCSAFTQLLYATVFNIAGLPRTAASQYQDCIRVPRDDLREGDLVFFHALSSTRRRRAFKRIIHVGIYLGNDRFVHASTSAGVTISDLTASYWKKRYAGAGRISESGAKGKWPGSGSGNFSRSG